MERVGQYQVVVQSSVGDIQTYFVAHTTLVSNKNSGDTHKVSLSRDGTVKICDCIRPEKRPCVHLLAAASKNGSLSEIFSSKEKTLQWFHSCFLMENVVLAYSLFIDPAVSSTNGLTPDALSARKVVVGRGAPQKLRFASIGASIIGDKSGVTFKKSCSNCGSRQHTIVKCPLPTLGPKARAIMICDMIRKTTNDDNNKGAIRTVRHERFLDKYVSHHEKNIA